MPLVYQQVTKSLAGLWRPARLFLRSDKVPRLRGTFRFEGSLDEAQGTPQSLGTVPCFPGPCAQAAQGRVPQDQGLDRTVQCLRSRAFDVVAEELVPAAGGCDSRIVLLLQSREGWEKHKPEYVQPWIRRGVSQYDPVVPGENGTLDLEAASARLREATGIFIGGGHTPTYYWLYATDTIA